MTDTESAWVAGLFEGEGWVGIAKGKYPYLILKMTDEDVILKLQETVGGGCVHRREGAKDHHKPLYVWDKMGRVFAETLYEQIKPHLGTRRTARFEEVLKV